MTIKLLGTVEISSRWSNLANHVVAIDNVMADGMSRFRSGEIPATQAAQTQGKRSQEIRWGVDGNSGVSLCWMERGRMLDSKYVAHGVKRASLLYFPLKHNVQVPETIVETLTPKNKEPVGSMARTTSQRTIGADVGEKSGEVDYLFGE